RRHRERLHAPRAPGPDLSAPRPRGRARSMASPQETCAAEGVGQGGVLRTPPSRPIFSRMPAAHLDPGASRPGATSAPALAAIFVYPVKSAAGIALDAVELDAFGPRHDRRWLVVDPAGRFMTQRRHPRLALVRPTLGSDTLTLDAPGMPTLALPLDPPGAATERARIWNDEDRKSTRLNSSHVKISYAVCCSKKKPTRTTPWACAFVPRWAALPVRGRAPRPRRSPLPRHDALPIYAAPPPAPRAGPPHARFGHPDARRPRHADARAAARSARCRHRTRAHLERRRSEEHTSELQPRENIVCRLLLEKETDEDDAVGLRLRPAVGRPPRARACAAPPAVPSSPTRRSSDLRSAATRASRWSAPRSVRTP